MPRYFDITLPISEHMVTYPDDPSVRIRAHSSIANGGEANVSELSFGSHTGTHLDAAHHFVDGGQTVDEIPIERLIGPARVVQIPDEIRAIGEKELRAAGVEGAWRLLLRTRNRGLLQRDEFVRDFAYLTAEGAHYLADSGVCLVGIDYLSIEAYEADDPAAHLTLLEREIVVVEGLVLDEVPPGEYELFCLPLKIRGLDGAPLRAVLRSPD